MNVLNIGDKMKQVNIVQLVKNTKILSSSNANTIINLVDLRTLNSEKKINAVLNENKKIRQYSELH